MNKLASLDSDIVREAEYHITLKDNQTVVRAHVSKTGGGTPGKAYEGTWEYAILLRAVGGWKVVASGADIETGTPKTHGQVASMIREQYGDGFHYMARDRYGVIGERASIIHIRRDTPANIGAYCGMSLTHPYVPGSSGGYEQHCIECTDTYRAEHWGRTPVEDH